MAVLQEASLSKVRYRTAKEDPATDFKDRNI